MGKLSATIRATPRFYINMSIEYLDVLMDCSKKHDCLDCKQAGLQGGFLYGWYGSVSHLADDEEPIVTATWRDLDLLSKIIENPPPMTQAKYKLIDEIGTLIHFVLSTANDALSKIEVNVRGTGHQFKIEEKKHEPPAKA